jgi:two-component system, OmpR family, response regulator PhoP
VAKILVVEDDIETIDAVRGVLQAERHVVDCAESADLGWDFIRQYQYDLMVFDWEMPGMSGVELLRKLRAAGIKTPIIMLTGRTGTPNVVSGLDSGADSYLTKPFESDVLLSVVRANLRRTVSSGMAGIRCEDLELFPDSALVVCGEKQTTLTSREVVALKLLLENPTRIITHEELRLCIDPDNGEMAPTALRMFLSNLREKLTSIGSRLQLMNVRGYGYQLKF